MATILRYGGGTSGRTSVHNARSSGAEPLSAIAAIVRRCDPDRYQTALFAPAARREALFALYAFNYEIARVRESVTEPALGHIRLEWWRETVAAAYDGAPVRRHPVAEALTEMVRAAAPAREHFERLIDARAADLDDEPPASLAALEDYAEGTSSQLVLLALEVLGTRDPAAAATCRHAGIAYGLAGILRALPLIAQTGRRIIPVDFAGRGALEPAVWREAAPKIAELAHRHLRRARAGWRTIPRPALAALLPTVIAAHTLRRLGRAGGDPFDPALAQPDPLQAWRLAIAALRRRF
jgi:NADH dehydrogenase [ubiquinone] 1 alpha subcomplex assembly factor 6